MKGYNHYEFGEPARFPMKKVILATQLIEKRITYADHIIDGIPSERKLAEELGLSRTTVRKAVQHLMDQGALKRQGNGRLEVALSSGKPRPKTIGFIAPVGTSSNRDEWRESISGVVCSFAEEHSIVLRSVNYGHWADPVIQEALSNFDGAFFMTDSENIPKWLLTKIKESNCRLISLDKDYTNVGIPSILLFPPAAEQKLFDYLYRLGHRRIDCLNTQVMDAVIQNRISVWSDYNDAKKISGQLHSRTMSKPVESAYQLVRDALQEGRSLAPALFCTTGPTAIGAMRAFHEAGIRIGNDVSVCAINSEGLGRYLLRSLTALEAPPRAIYLRRALSWALSDKDWQGPMLVQPEDVPLFEGQSTGPANSLVANI
jgi:DNA-binding LacI/PurR family transcriptional regulator